VPSQFGGGRWMQDKVCCHETRLPESSHAGTHEEDVHRIEHALPKGSVAGERYAPAMMEIING